MLPRLDDHPAVVDAAILRAVTILSCIAVSLVVAYCIGTGQTSFLGIAAGLAMPIVVTTVLQQRAWVLVPLAWAFTGSCLFLPFHISFREVAILLAASSYASFRVLTRKDLHIRTQILDWILALIVLSTIVDFLLHPVGVQVLGTEMIGGRAYFSIALAVVAYWVIVRLPDSPKPVSRIPYFILAGTAAVAALNLIVYIAPSTTPYLWFFYGGVDYSEFVRSSVKAEPLVTRLTGLRDLGYTLVLVLCALYPPKTLFNPLRARFYLFILGFVLVLFAGFRGTFLAIVMAVAISSFLQRSWRGLVIPTLVGGLVLGAVIFGQGRLFDLPLGAQRALSFLPGNWSPIVQVDAENSSQTRFEWWHQIIQEDVIKNWWFGDGFGVSEKEFENVSGRTTFFEWYMLTGGFHNGPLTTIRFAGMIGLVLFYAFAITAAVYAVKCVRLCRGTSLEAAAIFVAIQLIWFPVEFTLIFGSYDVELPNEVLLVALLVLLMRMARTGADGDHPAARASIHDLKPAMS